jgi:uncharacterized cupredoxin-like copper-binding protein
MQKNVITMFNVSAVFLSRLLKSTLLAIFLSSCLLLASVSPAFANVVQPIEVKVSLGNSAGDLRFFPDNLEFKTGKIYKLILSNPSPTKHYFTENLG